ncbi:MAG: secondary thiamine-phosphate synthase enzyme YjbQ [Deltaproteobacteria bacterium]|jgi:secondary thiamine-phosphate synthase enzyme|nr:secondary thiamine-phosphate synthase enzyme YjbQ [Deltaproteobacteria bacterium]
MIKTITIKTTQQEFVEITRKVEEVIRESGIEEGLCTIFVPHTSASLIIQENADPAVKADIQRWINDLFSLVPTKFSHVLEGPDDMPSHIKSVLTNTSLSIPILDGQLALGTWQGVYLWEHRKTPHNREVLVSLVSG